MKLFHHAAGATRSRFFAIPIGLLLLSALTTLLFAGSALSAQATVNLGNAESFGALSATAMTNAGANTVVNGDIGSSTSIDAGVTHPGYGAYGAGSSQLANAQAALLTAYGSAEAATPNQPTITGANLAGKTLAPGVYNSTSGILISGPIALTLDGGGDPSSVFIFQAASSGDLTVDPTSSVTYTNGAQPCNVFWKVNSAFLKNTDHTFVGTILALTQITLTEHITVEGRVLARNADVTFIHDVVNKPTCAAGTTPPTGTSTTPTTTSPTTTTPTTPSTRPTKPVAKPKAKPKSKSKTTSLKVTPRPKPSPPKHSFGLTG
jgi:type VI secretion system secreted protein VgrG